MLKNISKRKKDQKLEKLTRHFGNDPEVKIFLKEKPKIDFVTIYETQNSQGEFFTVLLPYRFNKPPQKGVVLIDEAKLVFPNIELAKEFAVLMNAEIRSFN